MTRGWKTSEFWTLVAGSAVAIANEGFGLGLEAETIVAFAGMVVSYVLGRSGLKAAQVRNKEYKP
jgi:membrane protein DedA with SNARE-associated domain